MFPAHLDHRLTPLYVPDPGHISPKAPTGESEAASKEVYNTTRILSCLIEHLDQRQLPGDDTLSGVCLMALVDGLARDSKLFDLVHAQYTSLVSHTSNSRRCFEEVYRELQGKIHALQQLLESSPLSYGNKIQGEVPLGSLFELWVNYRVRERWLFDSAERPSYINVKTLVESLLLEAQLVPYHAMPRMMFIQEAEDGVIYGGFNATTYNSKEWESAYRQARKKLFDLQPGYRTLEAANKQSKEEEGTIKDTLHDLKHKTSTCTGVAYRLGPDVSRPETPDAPYRVTVLMPVNPCAKCSRLYNHRGRTTDDSIGHGQKKDFVIGACAEDQAVLFYVLAQA